MREHYWNDPATTTTKSSCLHVHWFLQDCQLTIKGHHRGKYLNTPTSERYLSFITHILWREVNKRIFRIKLKDSNLGGGGGGGGSECPRHNYVVAAAASSARYFHQYNFCLVYSIQFICAIRSDVVRCFYSDSFDW